MSIKKVTFTLEQSLLQILHGEIDSVQTNSYLSKF